jgi:hypothetical protein
MLTVQVVPLALVQPVQEENVFVPEVAGAVSVTVAPESYVRVNEVLPDVLPFTSAGETPIATPLAGVAESIVSK